MGHDVRQADILANPLRDDAATAGRVAELLPEAGFREARAVIAAWAGYRPTRLVELVALAERLGLRRVSLKDESERLGLGSFKVLGSAYAVERLLGGAANPGSATVASATDGNHGRALAWGAQRLGCRCVIYLHRDVDPARERAIAKFDAEVVRAGDTYDDAFRACARDAAAEGWLLVSDTAPAGVGWEAAVLIMQGYRVLPDEALDELDEWPTHVFVQAGCGGIAAAVLAHLHARAEDCAVPALVVVEPETAACVRASAECGEPAVVEGDLRTIMAGLAVGEISLPAWELLRTGASAFQTIDDAAVEETMRELAGGEPPVVAGESGAAGVAGLVAVARDEQARQRLGLDTGSVVLCINTEGATAPDVYSRIVGRSAEEVRG